MPGLRGTRPDEAGRDGGHHRRGIRGRPEPGAGRGNGPVLIRGRRVPMLACCMDQTIVDVTGLDCQVDGRGDPVRVRPGGKFSLRPGGVPPHRGRRGVRAHLPTQRAGGPGIRGTVKNVPEGATFRHVQLVENLCSDESARVSAGELEGAAAASSGIECLNALHGKAFSERSEDFSAAQRRESNGIFTGCRKVLRLFRQPERAGRCNLPARCSSIETDGKI